MVTVPADTPSTNPDVEPIVAIPVLLLLHTPPAVASFKVVVPSTQTLVTPVIEDGKGFTVTTVVVRQPVGKV